MKVLINRVSILGETYTIYKDSEDDDFRLKESDGYTDWTTKIIVIWDGSCWERQNSVGNIEKYRNKVLRHEIIHAFVMESGLHEAATFDDDHFEQMVDWIAIQFPKIQEVFEKLRCL